MSQMRISNGEESKTQRQLSSFNLKQSSRQVAEDEDGRQGQMSSLQEVDGVQEQEVTWDYKDDQDSG